MYPFKYILPMLAILFIVSSCSDDPVIPNEEELITTLIWTFTPVAGGATAEMRFTDLDGDGGNAPVITTEPLQANTDYTAALRLLNETETPPEEITEEVEAEDEAHQFFFTVAGGLNLAIAYDDMDPNNHPVGLSTTADAGNASSGSVTVVLRHEPDKDAPGVSDGDITNAGGETDIEVTFDIDIQ